MVEQFTTLAANNLISWSELHMMNVLRRVANSFKVTESHIRDVYQMLQLVGYVLEPDSQKRGADFDG